jgi:GT2 family glycosyltransferase
VDVDRFTGPFNWALMNNLAAHKSEEDVLIFLNNDTLVLNPDWIDELVSLAMRKDVGVVGCRLIYDDGAIQHAGFLALNERRRFLTHDGLGDPGSYPGYLGRNALVHRTVAVTGACLAVRREVFRHLGGFDAARFQVEANDVDLCFKAADLGLKVLYSPFATLHHLESRTRTLDSEDDIRTSSDAAERIWTRWVKKVCPDPWYNPRFDRRSPHFSRLIPK